MSAYPIEILRLTAGGSLSGFVLAIALWLFYRYRARRSSDIEDEINEKALNRTGPTVFGIGLILVIVSAVAFGMWINRGCPESWEDMLVVIICCAWTLVLGASIGLMFLMSLIEWVKEV